MLTTKMILKKSIYYNEVVKLYEESFPENERIDIEFLVRKVIEKKAEFIAYFDNDVFVGFVYNVFNEKISFLLFLAILEKYRGLGYGSEILDLVKDSYKSVPVILAIEPLNKKADNYQIRVKRKQFYLKKQFKDSEFYYFEYDEKYDLLVWNEKVIQEEFNILMKNYTGPTMYSIMKPHLVKK
jgi:GNAT superfamily N-acetyltransferase